MSSNGKPTTAKRTCPCKLLSWNLSSFTAAEYGDVHSLSSRAVAGNINRQDAGGFTPLHYAAQHGHLKATALLLQWGANVDGRNANDGKEEENDSSSFCGATPLHRSSFSGAVETMKLLIDAGASLLARDSSCGDDMTALHKAAAGGRYLAVRLLLNALLEQGLLESALVARDAQNRTPLQVAREMDGGLVQRWNSVAGGPPDWGKCIQQLNEAEQEHRKLSLLSFAPPPVDWSQASCLVCDRGKNQNNNQCVTVPWSNSFRFVLESSIDCGVMKHNEAVKSSLEQPITPSQPEQARDCERIRVTITPSSEAHCDDKSLGRKCGSCGLRSFSLFRREGLLLCKKCTKHHDKKSKIRW